MKAKNYLFQAIDRSILETILNKDTTKSIWDSLKKKYQGTTQVQQAQRNLLVHEQRMKSHVVEEQALKVTFGESLEGKGRGRGGMQGRGRGGGKRNFDKSTIECYHCHKLGHF